MSYTLPNRYRNDNFAPDAPAMPLSLSIALVVSMTVHLVLVTVHFAFPDAGKRRAAPQTLEVVLVNSKSPKKVKSNLVAQANLEGGGNVDDDRRAKTPLPVARQIEQGDDLERTQRRAQELEAQQRQLLTAARSAKAVAATPNKTNPKAETDAPRLSGLDLRDAALLNIPLEAEVNRRMEEEAKRPRRKHIGTTVQEAKYALYVEQWRQKVERVGDANYPESARGRIFGSLQMTVTLNADGSVASMEVIRPSGHKVLDLAAEKIVNLAAPFAVFPQDIKRDYEQLVITRTWTFAPGDRVFSD